MSTWMINTRLTIVLRNPQARSSPALSRSYLKTGTSTGMAIFSENV